MPTFFKEFQSTHPLRGATYTSHSTMAHMRISIHAPLAGCDQCTACTASAETNFNPRTPCGVRPRFVYPFIPRARISIHAPLAGCDSSSRSMVWYIDNFNPRTPCGVRRQGGAGQPRGGEYFNPRTPCGVRLQNIAIHTAIGNFNPRTPCGVRPYTSHSTMAHMRISIHAPLAGCDCLNFHPSMYSKSYFNPRTPCGVRPEQVNKLTYKTNISIHAPLAGCDFCVSDARFPREISIHAPLAGCDNLDLAFDVLDGHFNPRTPCGVRPPRPFSAAASFCISIHAPLAGCDPTGWCSRRP